MFPWAMCGLLLDDHPTTAMLAVRQYLSHRLLNPSIFLIERRRVVIERALFESLWVLETLQVLSCLRVDGALLLENCNWLCFLHWDSILLSVGGQRSIEGRRSSSSGGLLHFEIIFSLVLDNGSLIGAGSLRNFALVQFLFGRLVDHDNVASRDLLYWFLACVVHRIGHYSCSSTDFSGG